MADVKKLIERVVRGESANEVVGYITEGPSKKDYVALGDHIRMHNKIAPPENQFNDTHINSLADHMKSQNSAFMKDRWVGYVKCQNGKNGGDVKK
jgi:hypothetical protein